MATINEAASTKAKAPGRPEPEWSPRKLRAILLAGFGGLLALMIAAGADALYSLRELHELQQQVGRQYLARSQALSTVVLSVHVYNSRVEQYLLAGSSAEAARKAAEVSSHAAELRSALQGYPQDREPDEQRLLGELQKQFAEEESSLSTMLSGGPQVQPDRARQLIVEEVVPRRLQILRISQQIAVLNRQQLNAADQALLARSAGLQKTLEWMLLLALGAGLLLSMVSIAYILRLERQGRQRYQELAESRRNLQELSACLVDAQEAERRSISRELHDQVGQSLGALLVDVGRLSAMVAPENGAMQQQIQRIRSVAEDSVKTVRNIALLLRPSMLDDLGLMPALEWQAREVSRRGEMEVEVHSEGASEKLPDEYKICIYRIVQEALNNAARHAGAKSATVNVGQSKDRIVVEVKDNGRGFESERVRGMGLVGMEERVKRLGGILSIDSQPGKGTLVRAELPFGRGEVDAAYAEDSHPAGRRS
ncbi:MAG TPA: sensor histidine kinase [Terriglobales bacterium]|nr:sensor histidine kinase [Terriglobales bacterium]